MTYQYHFTANPIAKESMYDAERRKLKAEKIVTVLTDYLGETRALTVLDVSCSTGIMCETLGDHFRQVTGIDIDEKAVSFAGSRNRNKNVGFCVMDALNTSFCDNSFDVVICNQTYEHVPDARKLMREIHRVLVGGGVCYFGATNRLKVIETHYGRLPFLSFLPKPLANIYLRVLGRGDYYYENLHTCGTLKRLCGDFERNDYTLRVIQQPEKFKATDIMQSGTLRQKLALLVLKFAYWVFPGYIWLLRKSEETVERRV